MSPRSRAASPTSPTGSSPLPSPTIVYDGERLSSPPSPRRQVSLLAPPDVPTLLRQKRKWWKRDWSMPAMPRSARMALMVLSIAMSSVQANGVYCWPTYGPVVKEALGLTKTQEQTIVVGGILGVYLCAAPLGSLVDRFGPRVGSLVSACMAATGYFSFAAILSRGAEAADENTYMALTACYFAIGAATVGSYFAALTTASLSFPSHPTLSLSLPLALLGLSPLILSSFSTLPAFTVPGHEINAIKFLSFLGCFSMSVNLFAAMFMRVTLPIVHHGFDDDSESEFDPYESAIADLSASLHLDERTPLLIGGPEAAREDVEAELQGKEVKWSAMRLVRNPGFWGFGLIITGCIGPSETLIASFGTVVTALLPPDSKLDLMAAINVLSQWATPTTISTLTRDSSGLLLRNKHVFILSVSSTLARLVTGFAADYLAPAPIAVPAPTPERYHDDDTDSENDDHDHEALSSSQHFFIQRDPVILRRSTFAALCAVALAAVYAWSAAYLDEEAKLWVLSGGVGALYGALFTLTPAIVSTHFGPTNFGLAWGMVSYFPAIGSAIFSYVFAFFATSDVQAPSPEAVEKMCHGPGCFSASFWIAAFGSVVAAIGLFAVGPRWKV